MLGIWWNSVNGNIIFPNDLFFSYNCLFLLLYVFASIGIHKSAVIRFPTGLSKMQMLYTSIQYKSYQRHFADNFLRLYQSYMRDTMLDCK